MCMSKCSNYAVTLNSNTVLLLAVNKRIFGMESVPQKVLDSAKISKDSMDSTETLFV